MNPQQESCPSHFTWRWSGGNQSLSNRRCLGPLTPSSPPTLLSNAQRTLTSKLSSPWHSSMNAYIQNITLIYRGTFLILLWLKRINTLKKNQWKYPSLYLRLGSFLLTFAVMCNMLTLAFSLTLFAVKGNWLCGWSCFSGLRLLSTTTTKIGAMWPELV